LIHEELLTTNLKTLGIFLSAQVYRYVEAFYANRQNSPAF